MSLTEVDQLIFNTVDIIYYLAFQFGLVTEKTFSNEPVTFYSLFLSEDKNILDYRIMCFSYKNKQWIMSIV
jgi:hypothetical protein